MNDAPIILIRNLRKVYRVGKVDVGVVNVLYGSVDGLSAAGNQAWDEEAMGIGGFGSSGDEFGNAVAIAGQNYSAELLAFKLP